MTPFIHPEDVSYTLNSWHGDQSCGNCAQFATCPILVTLRWDGAWCDLWIGTRLETNPVAQDNPEFQRTG